MSAFTWMARTAPGSTSAMFQRLRWAGVEHADGFCLNVSNYQYTANSIQYGSWISNCISPLAPAVSADCQPVLERWPSGHENRRPSRRWQGVALSPLGEWSDDSNDPTRNTSGINERYDGVVPTTHFVIDTSRNGQGPWSPPAYPDPQDWCNPPGRDWVSLLRRILAMC